MKIFPNRTYSFILFVAVLKLSNTYAQEPSKNNTRISTVLNISFPDSFSVNKDGFENTYTGGDSLCYYELNYFDTVIVKTNKEYDFNIALKGYVAGKFAGDGFKAYDLWLTDTIIGNIPGLFISGKTNDTLQLVKKFYCFLTIANSKNYWFYCYFGESAIAINKAKNFFSSIQFNHKKIKEATFKINSFKKHKVAGKVWYLSPELDYEWSAKESKEENKGKASYPPPPPPPPLNKKWLVKANKLASDFSINQSLADKKYKINSWIIVEGTVKEIKETDEHGTTIIILNGAPAKIDVQCEILNSFKIKNLKKGMKAIFDARCAGVNGNVILSKCIYIEKPTYE